MEKGAAHIQSCLNAVLTPMLTQIESARPWCLTPQKAIPAQCTVIGPGCTGRSLEGRNKNLRTFRGLPYWWSLGVWWGLAEG